MLPSIISRQVQRGIYDFLQTTFPITSPYFENLLERFTGKEQVLFKGPWISVKLPFQTDSLPPDFFSGPELGFAPYAHQKKAFERLMASPPKSTLVATGTGSGKTESFLLPILEHCYRRRNEDGIKAILIYPMNALASDQARRIAKLIDQNDRLKGNISAGIYVGGKEKESVKRMMADALISDRKALRNTPPDILLTNYKMLDYLLLRPDDQTLWRLNTPETLQFLVVDELHTFDGAQGTDLACLLRRLKKHLNIPPGHLCCVGTSATLGSEDSITDLREYADSVFAETFDEASVIDENLLPLDEFLRNSQLRFTAAPSSEHIDKLLYENYRDIESYVEAQAELWFGKVDYQQYEELMLALPELLKSQLHVRELLNRCGRRPESMQNVTEHLQPLFGPEPDDSYADALLDSLIALISAARLPDKKGIKPFLDVRIQLWLREMRRMVSTLDNPPELRFSSDLGEEELAGCLPLLHCRDCGTTGWGALKKQHNPSVQTDLRDFYSAFFSHSPSQIFLFPQEEAPAGKGVVMQLCSHCRLLLDKDTKSCSSCGKADLIRVACHADVKKTKNNVNKVYPNCPNCSAKNGLSIVGSQAASLISIAISQLYASPYNDDKKLLTFSDSVQDAAHRAGFFAARTYRFNFRGALQQALQEVGASPTLEEMTDVFYTHWMRQMDTAKFWSTFTPSDMHWLSEYEAFLKSGTANPAIEFAKLLRSRISWEIFSEYGFRSRVGRTLEKSSSSIAVVPQSLLKLAVEQLLTRLRGEIGGLENLGQEELLQFMYGILIQLRIKGGILHPALNTYVSEFGNTYLLNKVPFMPGFGPGMRAPSFLTTRSGGDRFDVLLPSVNSQTWHTSWAVKCFMRTNELFDEQLSRDIYEFTLQSLVEQDVLTVQESKKHRIWGLNPQSLQLDLQVKQLRCDACGHNVSTSPLQAELAEMPCLRYGCGGKYQYEESRALNYHKRLYAEGDIQRIFAEEHTGLLERDPRENLEKRFKAPEHPADPNLLSCTPTLEMGVDIGDLSSLVLCSVPPAQANYLQRVGRAGRKDGNAFSLTVAAGRPHDLYFFADPAEMISGEVQPPGIFLNAPAVLERQFAAHSFSNWISSGEDVFIPKRLEGALSKFSAKDPRRFPFNWLAYLRLNSSGLLQGFLRMFSPELGEEARLHLQGLLTGDVEDLEILPARIERAFSEALDERDSFRKRIQELARRIREMQENPAPDKDQEKQVGELISEKKALQLIIDKLLRKDIFNFLTEEGILPNYAFPEAGVLLRSVIYRKRESAEGGYETTLYEYERPAASAIHELAPSNQFYAGGRRVVIDQVDLNQMEMEEWRFCNNCSYSVLEINNVHAASCPQCGSPGWSDRNQVQQMLRMKQVTATTSDRKSRLQDDTDERQPEFYNKRMRVVVPPEAITAAFKIENEELPFGFEFVSQAGLREINFGQSSNSGEKINIAGEEMPRQGFVVCSRCGKVEQPNTDRNWHAFGCPTRRKNAPDVTLSGFYLYREFQSEALRILIPAMLDPESKAITNSFIAAMFLGLKTFFGGNIDHLQTAVQEEPYAETSYNRYYVVLYDKVPGGTGFLKELMRNEKVLFEVLEKGLEKMKACPNCGTNDSDGCYRCIYAYRFSYDMQNISRKIAMELLQKILEKRDSVKPIERISAISLNPLFESELEKRFIAALNANENVVVQQEHDGRKTRLRLQVNNQNWRIEPQVTLGEVEGISVPSRADFVFYPVGETKSLPIAVFTDGRAFHAGSHAEDRRVGYDMAQRMAIVKSGRYLCWSLTWKDVENTFEKMGEYYQKYIFPAEGINPPAGQAGILAGKLKSSDSFKWLLEMLSNPNSNMWKSVADYYLNCIAKGSLQRTTTATLDKCIQEMYVEGESLNFDDLKNIPNGGTIVGYKLYHDSDDSIQLVKLFSVERLSDNAVGYTLITRLMDSDVAAARENFPEIWNGFLRLYNLMQFIPGCHFITTEGIRAGFYSVDSLDIEFVIALGSDRKSDGSDEWQLLMQSFDTSSAILIERMRDKLDEIPEFGFELIDETGAVITQAEVAFVQKRIALLDENELSMRENWEEKGWSAFAFKNAADDIDSFLQGIEE